VNATQRRSPTCSISADLLGADVTTIRIATRGSRQATTQSEHVAARLRAAGFETELVLIETLGDRTQADNVPLHSIGGQGVFVKEVQRAVLDGRADVAVHSAKDLPATDADGLEIGAFLARRSAADVLIGASLAGLAHGAPVATGSVRRRAQLRLVRPDLEFRELRGNITTRLERVPEGGAIVMALAALEILGLTDRVDDMLDPTRFVPAVGQGCVAVEARIGDREIGEALDAIDDAPTRRAVTIERAYLEELGAGCTLPVGAYVDGDLMHVFLADDAGHTAVTRAVELTGEAGEDLEIARRAARDAREVIATR
jgi:hydroxymethylbilane synthase